MSNRKLIGSSHISEFDQFLVKSMELLKEGNKIWPKSLFAERQCTCFVEANIGIESKRLLGIKQLHSNIGLKSKHFIHLIQKLDPAP